MGETTRDLRKARRHSAQAIPVCASMLVVFAVLLWLVDRFVTVPVWLSAIVLGLTAFTLVGDIINVAYCDRQLRRRGDA
jgi:hypothetical protein